METDSWTAYGKIWIPEKSGGCNSLENTLSLIILRLVCSCIHLCVSPHTCASFTLRVSFITECTVCVQSWKHTLATEIRGLRRAAPRKITQLCTEAPWGGGQLKRTQQNHSTLWFLNRHWQERFPLIPKFNWLRLHLQNHGVGMGEHIETDQCMCYINSWIHGENNLWMV